MEFVTKCIGRELEPVVFCGCKKCEERRKMEGKK